MGQARNALRAYAVDDPDPAAVLDRTNAALCRLFPSVLATVVFAVLDPASGTLAYANAGHPPPLVTSRAQTHYLADPSGLLLGFADDTTYETGRYALPPDAALLTYSDGLIEDGRRPVDEGLDALAELCASRRWGSAEQLCETAVATLLGSRTRADDVSLLAVRFAAT